MPANNTKSETAPPGIRWQDLRAMTPLASLREVLLPLPWLIGSLWLYSGPFWPQGVSGAAASFMFFLTALRLNHEAIHGNLGLPRHADHLVLHGLSALMLGSNHAVAHGHMRHHKYAMGPGDLEGKCGHMSAREVLLYGPRFPFEIVRAAWGAGRPRLRRQIALDLMLMLLLPGLAVALESRALGLHVAAMLAAQCLTAFFAVWITHRGTEGRGIAARSQRGWLARVAYLMFYHREHHLFPRVPVRRLPELAARLDREHEGYAAAHLPVVPLLDSRFRRQRARLFARETMQPERKAS